MCFTRSITQDLNHFFTSHTMKLYSINLLLVASQQEEQSFLIHRQLLYILCTISWLAPKSPISTQYVFSLCQFWYLHIYSIVFFFNCKQSIYYKSGLKTRRTVLAYSLPTLVHFVYNKLTMILTPKSPISTQYVFSLYQLTPFISMREQRCTWETPVPV